MLYFTKLFFTVLVATYYGIFSQIEAAKIWNRSNQKVFVHVTFVGDSGTISTFELNAGSSKVFRPSWPNYNLFDKSDTTYQVTFWDSKAKYNEYRLFGLGLAAVGGVLGGAGGGTAMGIVTTLYKEIGEPVFMEAYKNKGVVGSAINMKYEDGWCVFYGKGWGVDVGKTSTSLPSPENRYPYYVYTVNSKLSQYKQYYPGNAPIDIFKAASVTTNVGGHNAVKVVCTNNAVFVKKDTNGNWYEATVNAIDDERFTFKETNTDEWSIYLYDSSRDVSMQLDLWTKKVNYQGRFLYNIQQGYTTSQTVN